MFSISFTIESAVSFERLFGNFRFNFGSFWAILGHFWIADPIFDPDFFQRPSLRLWPPELKGIFHQIELPSSGPRSGNSISSEGLKVFALDRNVS